jgi:hypothetical protein
MSSAGAAGGGIGIGGRRVSLVGALLATEIALGVAAGVGIVAPRIILGLEALHRSPGIDQRNVDREVVAAHLPAHVAVVDHARQHLRRRIHLQEPAARFFAKVDASHTASSMPRRDEPAKQQVEVDPIDQLALRADRVERLQQQGPEQLLRGDRRPPDRRVGGGELPRHARQHNVGDPSITRNGCARGTGPPGRHRKTGCRFERPRRAS